MRLLTLALILAGLTVIGSGQTATKHSTSRAKAKRAPSASSAASTAAGAAQVGLQMLLKSITPDNYKQFGFGSLDEVTRAKLGDGVPLFM
jgi:cobalamin biosynthesis protein CobD/CbiB